MTVEVKRDIFQVYCVSPLIFALFMIPLTLFQKKITVVYFEKKPQKFNQLLFMGELKIDGKHESLIIFLGDMGYNLSAGIGMVIDCKR